MNHDAETFIIEIMPLVFNVRLSLVCVEIEKDFSGIINGFYTDNQLQSDKKITLLYTANHYDILYVREIEKDAFFAQHIEIKKSNSKDLLKSVRLQGNCGKNSNHFQFINFINFDISMCLDCLISFIANEMANVREQIEAGENIQTEIEDIKLTYQGIPIDKDLVRELTGFSFFDFVSEAKLEECIFCLKKRVASKLLIICDFGCSCCLDCLKKKILTATDGLIVLNNYEKPKERL